MSIRPQMVSATTLTDAELARVVEQRAKTATYDHDSECLREAAARFVSQSDRIRTLTAEVERLRGAFNDMYALHNAEHNEVLRLRDAATKATIHLLQTIPDTVKSVLLAEQGGDHE